jgi:hypothetical protein
MTYPLSPYPDTLQSALPLMAGGGNYRKVEAQ